MYSNLISNVDKCASTQQEFCKICLLRFSSMMERSSAPLQEITAHHHSALCKLTWLSIKFRCKCLDVCCGRSAQTSHQNVGAVAWRMLSILTVGTYWSAAFMTPNTVAPHQLHWWMRLHSATALLFLCHQLLQLNGEGFPLSAQQGMALNNS